jgi:hypothetical protein
MLIISPFDVTSIYNYLGVQTELFLYYLDTFVTIRTSEHCEITGL